MPSWGVQGDKENSEDKEVQGDFSINVYWTVNATPFERKPAPKSRAWSQACTPLAVDGTETVQAATPEPEAVIDGKLVYGGVKRPVPHGVLIGPPPRRE